MASKTSPKRLQGRRVETGKKPDKQPTPSSTQSVPQEAPAQEGPGAPLPPQEAPAEEKTPQEKPPAYVPPASQEKRQRSVVHYIAILFGAAFLLMLLAYVMDQRQQEVVQDINQSLTGLQDTLSNQSSLQDIYDDNVALIQQVDELEDQLSQAQEELERLRQSVAELETANGKIQEAMDWFWQLDEAYVRGRTSLCREIIAVMEDASTGTALKDYLSQESYTDNGRFSPAGRYEEIYEALY